MEETIQEEPKVETAQEVKEHKSFLKNTVGILLTVVLAFLMIYIYYLQNRNINVLSQSMEMSLAAGDHLAGNYRTYVGRYTTTKIKLDKTQAELDQTKVQLDESNRKLAEVNKQLDDVTSQLAASQSMLSQTKGMLLQAQDENVKLKQELQGLDQLTKAENADNLTQLQAKIDTLRQRDTQVSLQLADLKSQLRSFQANFSSLEEGKSLIVLFQNKIKFIKSHMRYLKQEAYFARVAAQKEKDRVALLNGNSGFIFRDNQTKKVDSAKKPFAIDVKILP
ncbi:MAG: hypothetical protein HQL13_01225 [Candidatus Omnitrophica bacterium]|nr:hypothetical protein [Candidatus Omnitrophota bacterium]